MAQKILKIFLFSAICADVISFTAKLRFEIVFFSRLQFFENNDSKIFFVVVTSFKEFIDESVRALNDLKTYNLLGQRSTMIGYKINSIIYAGYQSSESLQQIQDKAIQVRTEFRIKGEIDKKNNEMTDLKLKGENERIKLENEIRVLENDYKLKVEAEKVKSYLEIAQAKAAIEQEINEAEHKSALEIKQIEREIESSYLSSLEKLDVDVNQYKIESLKRSQYVDKRYEITSN